MRRVEELLTKAGLTADDILAHTVVSRIDEIERIERMIAGAEGRRTAALREVERRRAALARDMRRAAGVEYAQFEMVAPPGAAAGA